MSAVSEMHVSVRRIVDAIADVLAERDSLQEIATRLERENAELAGRMEKRKAVIESQAAELDSLRRQIETQRDSLKEAEGAVQFWKTYRHAVAVGDVDGQATVYLITKEEAERMAALRDAAMRIVDAIRWNAVA